MYVDVTFFDESIDAKRNRYTFRFRNIDTPFLLNKAHKHTKTYVAISPNTVDIPLSQDNINQGISSRIFPRLR